MGAKYLDTYFRVCSDRLNPDGIMALQAITVADQSYEQSRDSVDFIKRYIFPGGFLPSIGALASSIARVTDLSLFHLEDLTPHYAETLRRWRKRFIRNRGAIRALGYGEDFLRMWEYYLSLCEGGFEERHTASIQAVLTKPLCRREPILAPLRA